MVQVPTNVAGVAYYVNGELVTAPNGKASVTGEVTVVAVPTAWHSLADGAVAEWSSSFDDDDRRTGRATGHPLFPQAATTRRPTTHRRPPRVPQFPCRHPGRSQPAAFRRR